MLYESCSLFNHILVHLQSISSKIINYVLLYSHERAMHRYFCNFNPNIFITNAFLPNEDLSQYVILKIKHFVLFMPSPGSVVIKICGLNYVMMIR